MQNYLKGKNGQKEKRRLEKRHKTHYGGVVVSVAGKKIKGEVCNCLFKINKLEGGKGEILGQPESDLSANVWITTWGGID